MSNQMEYKCPACGGALAFDSASQILHSRGRINRENSLHLEA